MNYQQTGNEKLKPLAVAGDAKALDELELRGNTLTADGQLVKEIVRNYRDQFEVNHTEVTTVTDGRVTERTVDGRPVSKRIH